LIPAVTEAQQAPVTRLTRCKLLGEIRGAGLDGATLGEAFLALPRRPAELVRAGVLHLLWAQHLVTDLGTPLHPVRSEQDRSVLARAQTACADRFRRFVSASAEGSAGSLQCPVAPLRDP
jgi:hypothetical protein